MTNSDGEMTKDIGIEEITVGGLRGKYPNASFLDDDLVYFDDLRKVQFPTASVKLGCFFFAMVTEGHAEYVFDTKKRDVYSNDCIIVVENHVANGVKLSDDCQGMAIMFSKEFFRQILSGIHHPSYLFMFYSNHPVFKIDNQMVQELLGYRERIKYKIEDHSHPFRRELISSLIKALIYDLGSVMYRYQQDEMGTLSRAEIIFNDFISMVEENFKQERRVSWYADKLCITSKYLSEVVKNVSKRTPTDWIDTYVTMELRVLLRTSNLSIKEISERLNFSNQSFMGKYFRERVGVSPSTFRKGRLG